MFTKKQNNKIIIVGNKKGIFMPNHNGCEEGCKKNSFLKIIKEDKVEHQHLKDFVEERSNALLRSGLGHLWKGVYEDDCCICYDIYEFVLYENKFWRNTREKNCKSPTEDPEGWEKAFDSNIVHVVKSKEKLLNLDREFDNKIVYLEGCYEDGDYGQGLYIKNPDGCTNCGDYHINGWRPFTSNNRIIDLDSFNDLTAHLGECYSTVILNDGGRSGIYYFDKTKVDKDYNGIIKNGWCLQDFNFITPDLFGAEAGTDATKAIDDAFEYLDKETKGLHNHIVIPFGNYIYNGDAPSYRFLIIQGSVLNSNGDVRTVGAFNLQSHSGSCRIMRGNGNYNGKPRDELLFWSKYVREDGRNKPKGAGMHLYGANDPKHGADIYMFTYVNGGHDRVLIAGANETPHEYDQKTTIDTRMIVGNSPFQCKENKEYIGTLTLHNSSGGRPLLYFNRGGSDNIGVDNNHDFGINTYIPDSENPQDIKPEKRNRLIVKSSGELQLFDTSDNVAKDKYTSITPHHETDKGDGREYTSFRAAGMADSKAAKFVAFGSDDKISPSCWKFYAETEALRITPEDFRTIDADGEPLIRSRRDGSKIISIYSKKEAFRVTPSYVAIRDNEEGNIIVFDRISKLIRLNRVPTKDPKISGAIWSDNGTLKISPW